LVWSQVRLEQLNMVLTGKTFKDAQGNELSPARTACKICTSRWPLIYIVISFLVMLGLYLAFAGVLLTSYRVGHFEHARKLNFIEQIYWFQARSESSMRASVYASGKFFPRSAFAKKTFYASLNATIPAYPASLFYVLAWSFYWGNLNYYIDRYNGLTNYEDPFTASTEFATMMTTRTQLEANMVQFTSRTINATRAQQIFNSPTYTSIFQKMNDTLYQTSLDIREEVQVDRREFTNEVIGICAGVLFVLAVNILFGLYLSKIKYRGVNVDIKRREKSVNGGGAVSSTTTPRGMKVAVVKD